MALEREIAVVRAAAQQAVEQVGRAAALPAIFEQGVGLHHDHHARQLALACDGECAREPLPVGFEAVFVFTVAAAGGLVVVVVARHVERDEQDAAGFPARVLAVAAELGLVGLAHHRHGPLAERVVVGVEQIA